MEARGDSREAVSSKTGDRPTVFISYSHRDEVWKNRLVTQLGVLQHGGLLETWDDRRIHAGDDWYPEIEGAMNRAKVAVLLISADFLTSSFILKEEVPKLLKRREKEGLRIVPIIVRPCPWPGVAWLSSMQARPKDGRPVSDGTENQQEHDWSDIAAEIGALMNLEFALPVPARTTGTAGETTPARSSETYRFYPPALVDRLDKLTVGRHDAEKRGSRISQSDVDEIRNTVRALNETRPPRMGDMVAGAALVDIIGSGTYGDVWEAVDATSGKKVAVKVFHAGKLGLSLTLHYFRRGVEAMDRLTHCPGRPESVIELLQVEPSKLAFSMPLMPRTDLSKTIKNWTVEKKVVFFKSLCEAVTFAHANQVLHRDIKPENILVADGLKPVLTDFDICDLLYKNTLSTQAVGTVLYTSPEQLQGTNERCFTADVYSLGRILHFLLLEKNPIIQHERLPILEDLQGKPECLVRVVRKCTQFEPSKRYQTVDELLADVKKCEADQKTVDVGVSRDSDLAKKPQRWMKKHPGAVAIIFAAVIAAIAVVTVALIPVIFKTDVPPASTNATPLTKPVPPDPKTEFRIDPKPDTLKESIVSDKGGYVLVGLAGGNYPMGIHSENETHSVEIKPFYMGRYEVTNEEYKRFLDANPGEKKPVYWEDENFNKPKQPVVGVRWDNAQRYCEWAGLRLPSEAEWEWAARAGAATRFWSGDKDEDLARVGWFAGNSEGRPHDVGEKQANPFGLYDIHGNVWEWVEDDWHDNYDGAPKDGGAWVDNPRAEGRVARGGSWDFAAEYCRSAVRSYWFPGFRGGFLGFRPARSIP